MNWSTADYLLAAGLLGVIALVVLFVLKAKTSLSYKAGAVMALGTALVLFWVSGAVGIIGSSADDSNVMFLMVIALAALGTMFVRYRAAGLGTVMSIAAAAQVLVGLVALVAGLGQGAAMWPWDILVATVVFTLGWGAAAVLFRRAATLPSPDQS